MGNWSPAFQLSQNRDELRMTKEKQVTVLGAGYSGLTTAAELTLRGFKVRVVAADLGDRELVTIGRFIGLSSKEESGVKIVPALKVSRKADNTWNRRPLDEGRLSAASEGQRNMRMI